MKLLLKYFFACFLCSLLVLCCILFSVISLLQKPQQYMSETEIEYQQFDMKAYNNNLKKLSDQAKNVESPETLRWQQIDKASLDTLRSYAVGNCTRALQTSGGLYRAEHYFLRVIYAKSTPCFDTINFMLGRFNVPSKELNDFIYLQNVTLSEIDNLVTSHIQLIEELTVQCNETCQALKSSTSTLTYNSTMLNQSITEIKESSAKVISQLSNRVSDLKEIFLEFAEFAIAMAKEADESDTTVEQEFKKIAKTIVTQKNKIGSLHKTLMKRRKMFLVSLENLSHKISKDEIK